MVHRVDGPIGAYRGFDDGTDARIAEVNAAFASATIFQSEFSLAKHRELGFELREPVVIPNAVDPAIFHPPASREPLAGRRIRVVALELVRQSAQGRRSARVARPEPRPRSLRAHVRRTAPDGRFRADPRRRAARLDRAGRAAAHAGPLRRTQLGRPVLERPAGSARLRPAGRLPRQRRSSGARRREAGVPFREDGDVGAAIERLVSEIDARRASIETRSIVVGRGPLPRGPRRSGGPLESGAVENYLRRGIRGARFRVDRRLDRAAVSRAHDVLYLSDAWTEATWLGAQALKNPLDLWVYQEIMFETRPELVVETGTYRGGSAAFLASMCDLLGEGEIVSIDIEQVRDDYPNHPRITYLGGRSSTDADVLAEVRARAEGKRTLVILDSDHSQRHVEAELAEYAGLVPVGGYVIVEDSNIGQIRKDLLPGPLEAIETFLATTDAFEIDRSREKFLITFNPSGYLRRVS